VVCRTLDVCLLARVDPNELLRNRMRMRLSLARHGRIPPDYWAGKDVAEMRAHYHELVEMVSAERATPSDVED
jgi:hypothetical protein